MGDICLLFPRSSPAWFSSVAGYTSKTDLRNVPLFQGHQKSVVIFEKNGAILTHISGGFRFVIGVPLVIIHLWIYRWYFPMEINHPAIKGVSWKIIPEPFSWILWIRSSSTSHLATSKAPLVAWGSMAVENLLQMIRKQPCNKMNKSWCRVSIIGDGSERGIVGVLQYVAMSFRDRDAKSLLLPSMPASHDKNCWLCRQYIQHPSCWEVHHAAKVPHRTAEWNPGRRYLKLSRSSTKMVTILVLLAGSYLSHGILR